MIWRHELFHEKRTQSSFINESVLLIVVLIIVNMENNQGSYFFIVKLREMSNL